MLPLVGHEVDKIALISQPVKKPTSNTITLREQVEGLYHLPIYQPKIGGVRRDVYVGKPVDALVEHRRHAALEPGGFVFFTNPHDDIGAFFPLADKFWNVAWRMLQVGIEHDGCVTIRCMESCRQGNFFAKVACQLN